MKTRFYVVRTDDQSVAFPTLAEARRCARVVVETGGEPWSEVHAVIVTGKASALLAGAYNLCLGVNEMNRAYPVANMSLPTELVEMWVPGALKVKWDVEDPFATPEYASKRAR